MPIFQEEIDTNVLLYNDEQNKKYECKADEICYDFEAKEYIRWSVIGLTPQQFELDSKGTYKAPITDAPKKMTWGKILLIVLVLALVGTGAYFLFKKPQ